MHGTTWPAIAHETLEWRSRYDTDGLSRRQRVDAALRSYDAAVPPVIAELRHAPPAALASELEEAAAEASRFDVEMGIELAPYLGILLRSESAASSTIENLTASARAVAAAEVGIDSRGNGGIIAANVQAMRRALEVDGPVDAPAIRQMHAALMVGDRWHEPGQWRAEPVWIGGSSISPCGATYVAPRHDRVPELIDDLVRFLATPDVSVLQQAALGHAQFETIHPFTDGNGRTGRALVHAHLRATGLVRQVALPVSAGLLASGRAYVDALTAYRAGDPDPVLRLFAEATLRAATEGRRLGHEVRDIRATWSAIVTARPQSRTWDLLDLLVRQPVVTAATLQTELGLAPGHVRRHVDPLLELGILKEQRVHRVRGTYWRAPEILTALDDFAARSGRRLPLR
ncbi:Fic family protein [Arsenicicoccus cauae]|uniref:Fic family protein n=1 Tax=Arsenicicoccus cauae TaxID=2663847 RepID=UPI00370D8343